MVAYDDSGGAIAARLWWMLQWLGHEKSMLLDGGWEQWKQEERPCSGKREPELKGEFNAKSPKPWIFDAEQISPSMKNGEILLLDVRNSSRFRGEKEPIDPIAGHIPGAKNEPFQVNLDSNGLWKKGKDLRRQYLERFPELEQKKCVIYCGSGVTACHTFFALKEAGFNNHSIATIIRLKEISVFFSCVFYDSVVRNLFHFSKLYQIIAPHKNVLYL